LNAALVARLAAPFRALAGLAANVFRGSAPAPARVPPRPSGAPPRREPVRRQPPSEAFTPTRPRAGRRQLVGRRQELGQALTALTEEGAHVVLYSERGRGKTSLANLVIEQLRRKGVMVGRHACDASSTFDQIIHGLLADLPPSLLPPSPEPGNVLPAADAQGCAGILPRRALLPADIAAIPARLGCPRIVFVVDEFDRVRDAATRTRLADTIKLLSDSTDGLRFMIVGVSDTLDQIIGQHPSIERNIFALHLPLLQDQEIAEMLQRGGTAAGVAFTAAACDIVAAIARGMPYMAQLMGLRITQSCLLRAAAETGQTDVVDAIDRLLNDTAADTAGKYAALVSSASVADMAQMLFQIARAPQDRWGRLSLPPALLASPALLDRLGAAQVVQPAAAAPGLYQVVDRRLIYFVLLRAVRFGPPNSATAPAQAGPAPALRSVAAPSQQ
jgi:hypothetical protein